MSPSVAARASTLALLLLATMGAMPAAGGSVDAETIFENARKAWAVGAYPRYATYATVVDYHSGAHHVRRTWDTIEDLRHEAVFSRKFSREEDANPPPPPRGINIAIPFLNNLSPNKEDDPIGHVEFAIDQNYGLAPGELRISAVDSISDFDAKGKALTVIGRTGVVARNYDVNLIETLDGDDGPEYHLGLKPLRDPTRNRLRELWVDGKTWLTEKAIVAGISNRAPLNAVSWRVDFREVDGASYLAQETALADLDYGSDGMLHDVTISFEELTAMPFPTGWKFAIGMADDHPLADP